MFKDLLIVLALTFRSLINFKLIFVHGISRTHFILLHVHIQFSKAIFTASLPTLKVEYEKPTLGRWSELSLQFPKSKVSRLPIWVLAVTKQGYRFLVRNMTFTTCSSHLDNSLC